LAERGSAAAGLTLEDMLDARIYADALNAELARSHGADMQIPIDAIPAKARSNAVETWCVGQGVPAPSKTHVSYRVLDLIADGRTVVAANRRTTLAGVHERLATALRLAELLGP
jgi:hypothetical protein